MKKYICLVVVLGLLIMSGCVEDVNADVDMSKMTNMEKANYYLKRAEVEGLFTDIAIKQRQLYSSLALCYFLKEIAEKEVSAKMLEGGEGE
jgi:hypothetical protein